MSRAATIPQRLKDAAETDSGELVFHLDDGPRRISAQELWDGACRRAVLLAERGIGREDRVGIVGANGPEWALWAFGVWVAGATVVPLQYPLGVRDQAIVSRQLRALAQRAGCRAVLSDGRFERAFEPGSVISWSERLPASAGDVAVSSIPLDDVAVIQFTSGSTGAQKGVMLEHDRVLHSVRMVSKGLGVTPADRFMGWAPLYHDLGLFGYLVRPLVEGCEGHILPTERFARDPGEWFRVMSKAGATLTTAPSSGYAVAMKAVERDESDVDLSTLRSALFGAEMIMPAVVDRLREQGPRYGLNQDAVGGSYGMAEATLTVSAQPGGMRMETKDVDQLAGGERGGGRGLTRRVCTCGPPVPETNVRITSQEGEEMSEGNVGEIELQAYGLMRGYLDVDPRETFRADGWFPTGDLGYVSHGELFVTGRIKDVLIVMGANFAPEDIEWAAERVRRVRKGRCIAFGSSDSDGEIVVALEARDGVETVGLASEVSRSVSSSIGVAPKEVLVLPRGAIPKTTSGKLRRSAIREAYERNELFPDDL